MKIDLMILGLIFDIIGVFILTLVAIFDYPHQRIYGGKEWWKRYFWFGWRPFLRIKHPSGKIERKIKWNYKPLVYGLIPPKYQGNIIGFLCVLIGFLLQLRFFST